MVQDSESSYRDAYGLDDKNNPFLTIDAIARGYRWQPSEIFSLTDTQLTLISHAAHVSYERGEEKRRQEKHCDFCGEDDAVFNDICSKCKRKKEVKTVTIKKNIQNYIEWPPYSGNYYYDDEFESAAQKLKKASKRDYMFWFTAGGVYGNQ